MAVFSFRYLTYYPVIGNIFTMMEKKHKKSSNEFLATTPVFTLDDFARYHGKSSLSDASNLLKYYRKTGRIINVARKIYATVPYGSNANTFQPDVYLVANAAREDAVFCNHSAIELLGASHSVWNMCTVFTGRKRNSIDLENVSIKFLLTPVALKNDHSIGTETTYRMNTALTVTGRERTLVEGFRKPLLSGGLEEHLESVSGFGALDLTLLKTILEKYNQKKLWASVGWFLCNYRERFGVSEDLIKKLEIHKPSSPQYLSIHQQQGLLDSRWNLIIPQNMTDRFEGNAT